MSNVKDNFKSKYKNVGFLCPLACGQYEDDQHLLQCSKTDVKFETIFYGDSDKSSVIIELLMEAEKIRDYLMETPPN